MDAVGGKGPRVLTGPPNVDGKAVPFYRQSLDFTCGPACLLMAMGRFDPALAPGREIEIDIWREANLVEARATSRQGLALAAHRRGFQVRTQGNVEAIELIDCLGFDLSPEDRKVAEALHRDLRRRCRRAGIPDALKPVSLPDIAGWLARGWIPIVLVDARLVGDARLPHWVVVTGVAPSAVTFLDPLTAAGEARVPEREFAGRLGFGGTTCAVVVEGRSGTVRGNGRGRPAVIPKRMVHSRGPPTPIGNRRS